MVETESYPSDEEKAEVKREEPPKEAPPKKEKKPKRIYSVEEKKEIALSLKRSLNLLNLLLLQRWCQSMKRKY